MRYTSKAGDYDDQRTAMVNPDRKEEDMSSPILDPDFEKETMDLEIIKKPTIRSSSSHSPSHRKE